MYLIQGLSLYPTARLDALNQALAKTSPGWHCLAVQACYLLPDGNKLDSQQREKLAAILLDRDDPSHDLPACADANQAWLSLPKAGARSPWASKTLDILQRCDLPIDSIEMGRIYHMQQPTQASQPPALLFDRMLEDCRPLAEVSAAHFAQTPRRGLQTITDLHASNADLGLSLSDDELTYLEQLADELGRPLHDVELMMFAQANSEHCRHKIFNAHWTLDGQPQQRTLFGMIRNTHNSWPQHVQTAYDDNSAVIDGHAQGLFCRTADGHYRHQAIPAPLLIKVETHNHPTAISPFPGAATGAGGEIRDEGATGRGGIPAAGLCGFIVSDLHLPDAARPWEDAAPHPDHLATPLQIMLQAPIGSAAYNNEFGRPCLNGFFRSWSWRDQHGKAYGYHKPVMLAGGIGHTRPELVRKQTLRAGDLVLVLGGPAMLIGLGGGATSSANSGALSGALDFASVQRGNPEMERRCQEVISHCVALGADNPIRSIHDVGAGGLSNAVPELVFDHGRGAVIQLRAIPTDDPALSPMELWCNEAQERYVLGLAKQDRADFLALCARERCPVAVIGQVTEQTRLHLIDAEQAGLAPIDLPLEKVLSHTPKMQRTAHTPTGLGSHFDINALDLEQLAERVLRLPAVASKAFLITIGDRSIGGRVARDQMVGPWQVPVADLAIILDNMQDNSGAAFATGERPQLALIKPEAAARMAVSEALTNLCAVAFRDLAQVKLSANWMAAAGSPGQDAALFHAVQALSMEFCPQLGLGIPVGKDSLSMQTHWQQDGHTAQQQSPVTPVISAFVPVPDARQQCTPQLRTDTEASLWLIDLGEGHNRLGGSAAAQVYGALGEQAPDMDDPALLRRFVRLLQTMHREQGLLAYHDRSDGGLFTTLLEMAFAGHCGLHIDLSPLTGSAAELLFNEEAGAVLQVQTADEARFHALLQRHQLSHCSHRIGHACAASDITIQHQGQTVLHQQRSHWQQLWDECSWQIQRLRDDAACADQAHQALTDEDSPGLTAATPQAHFPAPGLHTRRPQIAILREQGVNGHVEMAAAFDHAGFDAVDVSMQALHEGSQSLHDMQGLVACGGFSYGDVLGAGRGWANSILYNPALRDAFTAFFHDPERFALGVCNGCQMLARLRELIPGAAHWPLFVRNRSEQFEARTALVEILPSPSILLQDMAGLRLPVAVAHGEGRLQLRAGQPIAALNAQSCLRYLTPQAQAANRYPDNPNGSPEGLTGITSDDGRITLMMPHPERVTRSITCSWAPTTWGEHTPWMQLFHNARRWLG